MCSVFGSQISDTLVGDDRRLEVATLYVGGQFCYLSRCSVQFLPTAVSAVLPVSFASSVGRLLKRFWFARVTGDVIRLLL